MDDDLGRLITIGSCVAVGVVTIVIVTWLWATHRRESAAMRARRSQAMAIGQVVLGTPFEISGAGAGGRPQLHLDMKVDVLGGADVEVSFALCGVRLDYEILIDGVRVDGGAVKVPADTTRLGPDVRAVDTMFPSQRTRVRCTVPAGGAVSTPAGARVTVRGLATPLPNNEVHEINAWIG